jgi:hypothetical protein
MQAGYTYPVWARVTNFGTSTQFGVPVTYEVRDRFDAITSSWAYSLSQIEAGVDSFVFFGNWVAVADTHIFVSYTANLGDAIPANDTTRSARTYIYPHVGSGGPTAFWSWKDHTAPGGPTFNWVDIRPLGTRVVPADLDDGNTGMFEMGLNFMFMGNLYHRINANANGWLSFTDSTTTGYSSYNNVTIPNAAVPNNFVAPYWEDQYFYAGAIYFYYDSGANDFIVQYDSISLYGYSAYKHAYEVIFHGADNSITMQYRNFTLVSASPTVGLENLAGTAGLASCNMQIAQTPLSGCAILWTYGPPIVGETPGTLDLSVNQNQSASYPNSFAVINTGLAGLTYAAVAQHPWVTLTGITGSVAPSGSEFVGVNLNGVGRAPGAYVDSIYITSNDPATPLLKRPVINITVVPKAIISLAPASIAHSQARNSTVTYTGDLTISDIGGDTLNVSNIVCDLAWITPLTTSGVIPPAGTLPIDIQVNTNSLTPGAHSGTITVTSNDEVNPTKNVPITITVLAPNISITPASISHVQETDITCDLTWVIPQTTSGIILPAGTLPIDIQVITNGIGVGSYPGSITVDSDDPDTPAANLPITITVSEIVPSIPQIDIELYQGLHTIIPFTITNSSAATVIVTLTATELPTGQVSDGGDVPPTVANTWLFVEPPADTIPPHSSVTAQVIVNAMSLEPGSYHGMITLTSSNLIASIVEIPVDLIVNPPLCVFTVGDFNGVNGFTGIDVTALRNFFFGWPVPESTVECPLCASLGLNMIYPAGTVNGDCDVNGIDLTYMVNYFKGGPVVVPCQQCLPGGPALTAEPRSEPINSSK